MKTHFSKVGKSDHLGVSDLEELGQNNKPLIFTIKEVKQKLGGSVAGRTGNFNIAYFHEKIKPLVINATNGKTIKRFAKSPFIEDWTDITIELFIDPSVKMSGVVVGGIRIKQTQPKLTKTRLTASSERYAAVLKSCKEKTTTLDVIKTVFDVPADVEKHLKTLLDA